MNAQDNILPFVNQKIKNIIDLRYSGNVAKFSRDIGLSTSCRINRLFSLDARNGKYPSPSIDLIIKISDKMGVTTDSLLKPNSVEKNVNNINIKSHHTNGNNNIVENNGSINSSENNEYVSIIKKQQEQIDNLLKIIAHGRN